MWNQELKKETNSAEGSEIICTNIVLRIEEGNDADIQRCLTALAGGDP